MFKVINYRKQVGEPLQRDTLYKNNKKAEGLWYLTPLSTIVQLCRGGQFY